MNHENTYKKTLAILADRNISVNGNANTLEMACILYHQKMTKLERYDYLKRMNFNVQKTATIIHMVDCMKDVNHAVILTYAEYIDALRLAVRASS